MSLCLHERYPALAFLLSHFPYSKKERIFHIERELPSLKEIEVIYLNGLESLSLYPSLYSWLNENPERDLVIIEDDLGNLAMFLEREEAELMLSHPQAHLRFLLEGKTREQLYEELAQEFPFRKIEVLGDEQMALALMRKTTVAEALFAEDLCYHRICENLWRNSVYFRDAYDGDGLDHCFQGVPAIICGAGPSLTKEIPLLKGLTDRALIFAGGSTMTALSKGGVRPHFTFALDPNPQEVERLQETQTFEVPLFYGGRVKPEIFSLINGMKVYLRTHTGGSFEAYLQQTLELGEREFSSEFDQEALSVTTSCLSMAVRMGCNPIIFVGVDLAFTGGESYAPGVISDPHIQIENLLKEVKASERLLEQVGHNGQKVYTLVKWVMESRAMASFMKKQPKIQFINATSGGLGFDGIPYLPLQDISFGCSQDLEGLVHAVLIQHPIRLEEERLSEVLASMKESLGRCLVLVEEMRQDPKKEIYLLYDIEEEEGFKVILFPIFHAIERMAKRKYREDINKKNESKWNYLKSIIEYLMQIS